MKLNIPIMLEVGVVWRFTEHVLSFRRVWGGAGGSSLSVEASRSVCFRALSQPVKSTTRGRAEYSTVELDAGVLDHATLFLRYPNVQTVGVRISLFQASL